ncbi:ABC transporter substrate-binding protein [Halovivax sp.]|uniref:ABC transporter substrate-binding protein n=1 Tax=Halovivax sp. TaxID=1935978 RepID=UPI0025BA9CF6|nr:ABC transporter substrate-binding protein [Halovivax sp.]
MDDPDGEPVPEIVYENLDPDAPIRYWYGEEHANRLRDIGFEVDYQSRALDAHLERLFDTRDYDYSVQRWLDGFDPDNALRTPASEATLAEGGGNVAGYYDEEYEELLSDQRSAVDEDERQAIVHDMQEKLVTEHVLHPIIVQDRAMPYRTDAVSNVRGTLEDGLASIWNMIQVESEDGTLSAASHEDLTSLDPVTGLVTRANRDMISLVYDRLMHADPEQEYMPEPWAAESVEWPDDTTVEVTLREGMEWHDGEPVTAEDVVFTFEYHEEENPDFGGLAENLDTVEAETDLDVRFDLSEPDAIFESVILAGRNSSLIPQHVWEGREPDEIVDEEDYVGSGPFQFESISLGEELRLSAHGGHHHEPNVDEFIRVETADASSTASVVQGGEVDMVNFDLPPDQLVTLEDDDDIELESALMTSIHYGVMNQRREPFVNDTVRHATAHTIPREEIVEIGADGFGQVITSTLSPDLEFWYNDGIDPYEYDLERAMEILADDGFEWDTDGRLHYPPDYEMEEEWDDPNQPPS